MTSASTDLSFDEKIAKIKKRSFLVKDREKEEKEKEKFFEDLDSFLGDVEQKVIENATKTSYTLCTTNNFYIYDNQATIHEGSNVKQVPKHFIVKYMKEYVSRLNCKLHSQRFRCNITKNGNYYLYKVYYLYEE